MKFSTQSNGGFSLEIPLERENQQLGLRTNQWSLPELNGEVLNVLDTLLNVRIVLHACVAIHPLVHRLLGNALEIISVRILSDPRKSSRSPAKAITRHSAQLLSQSTNSNRAWTQADLNHTKIRTWAKSVAVSRQSFRKFALGQSGSNFSSSSSGDKELRKEL